MTQITFTLDCTVGDSYKFEDKGHEQELLYMTFSHYSRDGEARECSLLTCPGVVCPTLGFMAQQFCVTASGLWVVGFCAVGSFFLTFVTQPSCPSSSKDVALGSPDPSQRAIWESQYLIIPVFNNDLKAGESCLFKRQLKRIFFFSKKVIAIF